MPYSLPRLAPLRGALLLLVALAVGVSACTEREQPLQPEPELDVVGPELTEEPTPVDGLVVRWEAARAHSIDPGPSGTLFVQQLDGDYQSLSVEGGICELSPADAADLHWRGGVIGVHAGLGANQVAVEVKLQGQRLMLKLVHAFWIEVVDGETGAPLAALELWRHGEPGTGPGQEPPAAGEERNEDRLYAGPKNPVLVGKSELLTSARTVWVRAAGYGWGAARLHPDSAALQRVALTAN